MKILSLFDGMSCGRIALDRAGIKVDTYYSSEIDKYSSTISQKNYPDIIQQGDINNWRDWDIGEIDMVIGGSPCQGFSFAGKQLAFDDPRSKLFFTMVDIIEHYKPKYFLLENVKMKKEYQDIISEYLGVQPIEINSALVSAQNRKRLYWTNIPGIQQPQDKGILLKDVLQPQEDIDEKYFIKDEVLKNYTNKGVINSLGFDIVNPLKNGNIPKVISLYNNSVREDKVNTLGSNSQCITAKSGQLIVGMALRNRGEGKVPEINGSDKANSLTTVQTDSVILRIGNTNPSGRGMNGEIYHVDGKSPTLTTNKGEGIKIVAPIRLGHLGSGGQGERLYSLDGKSVALSANGGGMGAKTGLYVTPSIRKLTPIECERLQTVPDNYTEGVSNSQRYKMLGNGWTVDVISHIFSYIK